MEDENKVGTTEEVEETTEATEEATPSEEVSA